MEELAVSARSVLGKKGVDGIPSASLTIFAADHGIAVEGVSAFPQEVTGQMVLNFLAGGAAANAIAAALEIPVFVADCGVATPLEDASGLIDLRLGAGTKNSLHASAMTSDIAQKGITQRREYGAKLASNIACFGEMGIANTPAATLVAHKLSSIPVAQLVGRGTGLGDERLAHKRDVLERAAARTGTLAPIETLAQVGGYEIGTMAGAMIGAGDAGKLVIVDGFIATAAAALARSFDPECASSMIFAHRSAEAGHGALLDWLGARPLLDLDLRLGEGTGALLAVPLVRAALALFNMSSFDEAGVAGRVEPC